MSNFPKFGVAFNVGNNNEDRIKAFELYQKAFNAKKISESINPDGGDIHIVMDINGFEILLAPGGENAVGGEKGKENVVVCELKFDNENDLRKAYDVLIQDGYNYSIGSFPWATVFALVTDKYRVEWGLYYNEYKPNGKK
jgi:uncharacterized glyoxalase superfamily protein PhnB